MTKNLFPKSIRKHLRRRKAELRRALAREEAEAEIQKLVAHFRSVVKAPKRELSADQSDA